MLTGEEKLGVYEVELTEDWVKRSAPFLKVLSGTLSLALPIGASAAKLAMDAAAFDAIGQQLDFGKACAESFLKSGQQVGDWLSSDDATEMESSRAVLEQGAMLRELHALLKVRSERFRQPFRRSRPRAKQAPRIPILLHCYSATTMRAFESILEVPRGIRLVV